MTNLLTRTTLLVALTSLPLAAQTMPPGPPAVLWIQRELVKPGKNSAHNDWEAGWPRAFAQSNWPTTYLAMNAMSGPNEAWFLIGYPSFAAMEKDLAATDANATLTTEMKRLGAGESEYVETTSSILARYVPSLSHNPQVNLPKMRYFEVIRYTMKPGHDPDFARGANLYAEGSTRGKVDNHWATFQVVSGLPAGTYLVFVPMSSISTFDTGTADDNAIMTALGADKAAALGKVMTDGVATVQSQIFAFNPKMSYVGKDMKDADPFWR
jgi:hypothetical protein